MVTGEVLTATDTPRGIAQGQNAIWFGGGLTHLAVNGATINTIDDLTFAAFPYLATGLTSTGNKSTPTLKADLFGDWREELVLRASQNRLAVVTTLAPTAYGIRTLMHDPMYRNGVANKNNGYDQVGFASFYLGDEAELPKQRTDISVPNAPYDLTVSATASVRCIAGKAYVTVSVLNGDIAPINLALTSTYGEKKFTGIVPGKAALHSYTTRLGSVPTGTVTVDVTATVYGDPQSKQLTASYNATTCG